MGHEIDLKRYEIRTDLVLDTIENSNEEIKMAIDNYDNIKVTKEEVDDTDSRLLNKKKGNYITIEFEDVTDSENKKKVEEVFVKELKSLMDKIEINKDSPVLIIGLGNEKSTPDSLGPKVIENILVTRHIFLIGEDTKEGIRCTSAINPGVMATTGIETSNLVKAVAEEIAPSLIIVVDALAASSISRINKSIQITDTGIHPGSGVGNRRKEISKDTLGIPVIGIGVPTVVESSIIVYDTINYIFKHISYIKENQNKNKLIFKRNNYLNKIKDRSLSPKEQRDVLGLIGELSDIEKKNLINEVLTAVNYNFIVTPKEVDFQIDKLADLLSNGINKSLHENII